MEGLPPQWGGWMVWFAVPQILCLFTKLEKHVWVGVLRSLNPEATWSFWYSQRGWKVTPEVYRTYG